MSVTTSQPSSVRPRLGPHSSLSLALSRRFGPKARSELYRRRRGDPQRLGRADQLDAGGNLWVIGGQTQQGRVHPNAGYKPGFQRAGYPETVFVDNKPLKPVDALSKVVPGTFYFDYTADKIYIADNPTGHTIEAGKLTMPSTAAPRTSPCKISSSRSITRQFRTAHPGGKGWTIQDTEVRLNYTVGIIGRDGSKIIGNYVHDNGQMGLGGSGDNILVQGNEIAKNGYWSGIDVSGRAADSSSPTPITWSCAATTRTTITGSGMWTDINNIHTLYENNVVVHNTTAISAMKSATTRSSATTPSWQWVRRSARLVVGGSNSASRTPATSRYTATGST